MVRQLPCPLLPLPHTLGAWGHGTVGQEGEAPAGLGRGGGCESVVRGTGGGGELWVGSKEHMQGGEGCGLGVRGTDISGLLSTTKQKEVSQ